MLRTYHTAKHIITIHTAAMRQHDENAIIGRIHNTHNASDFAVIQSPSITYIIFAREVHALRAMLDLHGLGTIGYSVYAPSRQSVQYNYCENGLADFFTNVADAPAPKRFD